MFRLKIITLLLCITSIVQSQNLVPKKGKLNNGLTYYILSNKETPNKASFFLLNKAGAIVENDNEQGLAHFLEHMAFNGTKNFPGNTIKQTVEDLGIVYGRDINAAVNINNTIYQINKVPTNNPKAIETSLLILHDWIGYLTLNSEEINKEKGVIVEEKRLRNTVDYRKNNAIRPFLFNNSKYATRDIIGPEKVLLNTSSKQLKTFEEKWHRPDLQAIVIVGDVNLQEIEKQIQVLFNKIPKSEYKNQIPKITIPDNEKPNIAYHEDQEFTGVHFDYSIRTKFSTTPDNIEEYLKTTYIRHFFNKLMKKRIDELHRQKANTPLQNINIFCKPTLREYLTLQMNMVPKPNNAKEALEYTVGIMNLLSTNGFSKEEFNKMKKEQLFHLNENSKVENSLSNTFYIQQIKKEFLDNIPYHSVDWNNTMYKKIVENLTVKDINDFIKQLYVTKNRTVMVSSPPNITLPTKGEISKIIDSKVLTEYKPKKLLNVEKLDLVTIDLQSNKILKEEKIGKYAAKVFTLKNNMTVVYKRDHSLSDFVIVEGVSKGGLSRLDTELLPVSTMFSANGMDKHGLGNFNELELKKWLGTKGIKVGFNLYEHEENVKAICKETEFDGLMQYLYMRFEYPKFDKRVQNDLQEIHINRVTNSANTDQLIQDDIDQLINNNSRLLRKNVDYYKKMNIQNLEKAYKDRFIDASDWVFYIVGDIKESKVKELINKYLSNITDIDREDTPIDHNVTFPQGETRKVFNYDMPNNENSAINIMIYNKEMKGTLKYKMINSLAKSFLNEVLDRVIRENEGGTYHIGVDEIIRNDLEHLNISNSIQFSCQKNRVNELRAKVKACINGLIKQGIDPKYFELMVSAYRKRLLKTKKGTKYWVKALKAHMENKPLEDTNALRLKAINKLKIQDVNNYIRDYFTTANLVDVTFKAK